MSLQLLLVSVCVSCSLGALCAVCVFVVYLVTRHYNKELRSVVVIINKATQELAGRVFEEQCQRKVSKLFNIDPWTDAYAAKEYFARTGDKSSVLFEKQGKSSTSQRPTPMPKPPVIELSDQPKFRNINESEYDTSKIVPKDIFKSKH